jgi:hypothetical protein
VSAGNEAIVYRTRYASTALQASAGYDLGLGPLHLRPGLLSGVSWVDGRTTVSTVTLRDEITRWTVGPSLTAFVTIARVVIGVDAQAAFVPSTVASPTVGIYGLVGVEL